MWKDAGGREWSTAITVSTVKRVQELAGVLLTDVDVIERINHDPMLLCDVLCAIAKPQRDERNVTSEQFGELLAGATIDAAGDSFNQDLVDFFPPSRRQLISRILATTRKIQREQVRLVEERLTEEQINSLVGQAMRKVSENLDRHLATLGDDSGKSPESSVSTRPD